MAAEALDEIKSRHSKFIHSESFMSESAWSSDSKGINSYLNSYSPSNDENQGMLKPPIKKKSKRRVSQLIRTLTKSKVASTMRDSRKTIKSNDMVLMALNKPQNDDCKKLATLGGPHIPIPLKTIISRNSNRMDSVSSSKYSKLLTNRLSQKLYKPRTKNDTNSRNLKLEGAKSDSNFTKRYFLSDKDKEHIRVRFKALQPTNNHLSPVTIGSRKISMISSMKSIESKLPPQVGLVLLNTL